MFAHGAGHDGPAHDNGFDGPGPRGGRRGPHGQGRGAGRGGPFEGHGRGHRGRGFGRPGGWQQADLPSADDAAAWFSGRLPSDWFTGPADVSIDREEIIVTGELPPIDGADASPAATAGPAAAAGRISRFREETRGERIAIAAEAEQRYGRKIAWGASLGEEHSLFSHLAVPVMTRLRQPERQVLDTLVDAGVARSRSEALSWAVSLVGQHTDEWLASLREAMSEVDKLRTEGPDL